MKTPTKKQIEVVAAELAKGLGSGVHVYANDLIHAVEAKFGALGGARQAMCKCVADTTRRDALRKIWG